MVTEDQETEENLGYRAALLGLGGDFRITSNEALEVGRGHINEGPCRP